MSRIRRVELRRLPSRPARAAFGRPGGAGGLTHSVRGRRPAFLLACVAVAVLPIIVVPSLGAQDRDDGAFGPETAVLIKGPTPGEELPFLGPNVVSYWRGTYEYQEGTFVVYFTRDDVFGLGDWTSGECGDRQGRYLSGPEADGPDIWYLAAQSEGTEEGTDSQGAVEAAWHLFVDVRDFDGDVCEIMPQFLERIEFFYDALGEESREAPLPAVVGAAL